MERGGQGWSRELQIFERDRLKLNFGKIVDSRSSFASRGPCQWLGTKYVRTCLLPARTSRLGRGGQVSGKRSRHTLRFRYFRVPGGREHSATTPGSLRAL